MITFNEFIKNEGLFGFGKKQQAVNPRAEDQAWQALYKYFGNATQADQKYDQAMATGDQSGKYQIMKFLSGQQTQQPSTRQQSRQELQGQGRPSMFNYVPGQGRMPGGESPWYKGKSNDV